MHRTRLILLAAGVLSLSAVSAVKAQVVFGNFEDGTTDGFGYLTGTSAGVTANSFASGTSGTVITPSSGQDTTKVLDLTASGFNGGVGGADLGYDFASSADPGNAGGNVSFTATSGGNSVTLSVAPEVAEFLSNDYLNFNWETAPVSGETGGYSQLYNIILNAPGVNFTTVGGSSGTYANTTGTVNQNPPFSGQEFTVSVNYDTYKAAILASIVSTDSAPSYLQFGIQTNNGGGTPTALTDFYFDNFTLTAVPEPASLGLLGLGVGGMLVRRRRA